MTFTSRFNWAGILLALFMTVTIPNKDKPHNIRVKVSPSSDTTALRVEVQNEDYIRSSVFESDGTTIWVDFVNIPSGVYEVVVYEINPQGKIRSAKQNLMI